MNNEIDLEAVRLARKNLAKIAKEHPELVGESSVEEWIEILEEIEEADEMAKTIQVGVRFPPEVVEMIDQFAAETTVELRKSLPGLEVNRAGAIRILVEQALRGQGYEVEDSSKPRKKRRKQK